MKGILAKIMIIILINEYKPQNDIVNLDLYDYIIQIQNTKFNISFIENQISKSIINQIPIINQKIYKEDNEILSFSLKQSIELNSYGVETYMSLGKIYTDGSKIYIPYKNSLNKKTTNHFMIGTINNQQKLIELSESNDITYLNLDLISSCMPSIYSYINNFNIEKGATSFQIFSRKTLPFKSIPYLYFGNYVDSFSNYCQIDTSQITLICVFYQEDLDKFAGTKSKILEAIPGCETLQDTQIELHFQVPYCKQYDDDGKCKKCNSNYKIEKDGKLCEKNTLWMFIAFGILGWIVICAIIIICWYRIKKRE